MNRALLDTRTLLGLMEDDPKLGGAAKRLIETADVPLFFSFAGLWEMAVKQSIGKLSLSLSISDVVESRILAVGISLLDVRVEHITRDAELPMHHREPFDRLLAAQCLGENMGTLSRDALFDAYGVEREWD